MARPKSPDGKRVTMSVRFSEAEAAEIDAARGDMERSTWLRAVVVAALEPPAPAGPVSPPRRPRKPRGDTAPVATFTAPLDSPNARIALGADPDCPHPKARIHKGLCGACGTYVGTTTGGKR